MYAKLSKCSFYEDSVKYLGHVVSGNGMHVDPVKIQGNCRMTTTKGSIADAVVSWAWKLFQTFCARVF